MEERLTWIWTIDNFTRLHGKKIHSDAFHVGGYEWRIVIFPEGKNGDHLSVYLEAADSEELRCGWSRYAQLSLSVVNQWNTKYSLTKETQHEFNASESYCGFASFMPLAELYNPALGYIVNGTCIVEADVRILDDELHTIIKVARNEDLIEQIGKDIYFDLVDHNKVRRFRVHKHMPFNIFKKEVAKEFGVPLQFQRFWLWEKRQNRTYRPNRPLTVLEEAQSVEKIGEVSDTVNNAELKLFLEVELGPEKLPIAPPKKTEEEILLFFKLYDPSKEEIRFIGRMFVKGSGKPADILAELKDMAGFSPEEDIELYEEIKFEPVSMCEHIDTESTFRLSQIEDGDIICVQKSQDETSEQHRYPDVPSFFEYVHQRRIVNGEHTDNTPMKSDAVYAENCIQESTISGGFNDKEIGDAKTVFRQCLDMDVTSFSMSGKSFELKNALSVLLQTKLFPESLVDGITNFCANLNKVCEKYEAAQRDLTECQDNEGSLDEVKATLTQLLPKLMPAKNQAEAVDGEIARLEEKLAERKAKRVKLGKKVDELNEQLTASKKALLSAAKDLKMSKMKKKEAENTVTELQVFWESLRPYARTM